MKKNGSVMGEALRIGLVGCGAMGEGHLKVWQETPGVRVSAVCDGVFERAESLANRVGATAFADMEAMCASGVLDAVDICTPSGLHAQQGLIAAQQGLHVLVEKPLDLRLDRADSLIEACESRRLVLACNLQQRVFPAVQQVAQFIAEGKLGRLLSCSAAVKWWRSQEYYDSSGWRGTWEMDGGVLANQAIHTLDMLCLLVGGVAEVEYANLETANHHIEAEDNALAILRFENGARGVFEATTCSYPDLCSRIEIFGTRGSVAFDSANVVRLGWDGEDRLSLIESELRDAGGGRSNPMSIQLDAHTLLMQDFAAAVVEGRKPLVSGRDARVSLEALCKIYAKAFPNRF